MNNQLVKETKGTHENNNNGLRLMGSTKSNQWKFHVHPRKYKYKQQTPQQRQTSINDSNNNMLMSMFLLIASCQ